jgi:hypothetical protein
MEIILKKRKLLIEIIEERINKKLSLYEEHYNYSCIYIKKI